MAEEEEDDYMSDNFIIQTESVRPGLAWGKHAKKNENEKRQQAAATKNRLKPLKEREREERQKGLNSALTSENKGFAMLQKMGYKKGMGLGKQGTGRAEPVPIEVKADRGGLGREAELKRKQQIRERLEVEAMRKRQKMMGQLKGDFRQRMRDKFDDKKTGKDLYDSQKACQYLDGSKGVEEPDVSWYWPPKLVEKKIKEDDDDDDRGEGSSRDGLRIEVYESDDDGDHGEGSSRDGLRITAYESDDDDDHGEGSSRDGLRIKAYESEEEEEVEEEEIDEEDDYTPQEKLQQLTQYLRNTYHYCVWCGTSYEDGEDLQKNCPGSSHDDHN